MRNHFYLLLLLLSIYSCKEHGAETSGKDQLKAEVEVNELLSSFDRWWAYQYKNISLSSDFTALDTSFNAIPKGKFLWHLTSGNYVPVVMESDSVKVYKLYPIPPNSTGDIEQTIKNLANSEFQYYLMEGKAFPEFEAKSLEKKVFNNSELVGKTSVIKTWFIGCKPCIEEMPELNKLVDQYEDENIQFISLALDKKDELENFLEKTEFKYAVLPEQKDLIRNKLKLNAYPTHILVNKSGKIVKVFSKGSEMIGYLRDYMKDPYKEIDSPSITPPPPPGPTAESGT